MQLFIGRLTANAVVNTLKDERRVVNFSVAINDYYKAKGGDEGKKVTTYINCSYWLSAKIAERLTKGALVEIVGRLYVRSYMSGDEPKASLNCHIDSIKIHSFTKNGTPPAPVAAMAVPAEQDDDDLPF